MPLRNVSLLRGINVGGHNLIPMARLRAICESLGCEDVTTYLQSGNVVFRRAGGIRGFNTDLETAIQRELGLGIRVLDRTHAQMARIVAADPFPGAEPNRRLVMFLEKPPAGGVARELGHLTSGPDEAVLIGREFHLNLPNGFQATKLTGMLTERRIGVTATSRNWRTVVRLLELSGSQS